MAHTDRGSQYTAIRYTERLAEANIAASVGSVGSSYDNALAESINGLYKTELIKPRGPWRTLDAVEYRDRRMGRLVQPPPPLRVLRRHPTGRPRDRLLRSNTEPSRNWSSQTIESPDSPGRFISSTPVDVLGGLQNWPHGVAWVAILGGRSVFGSCLTIR